MNDKALTVKQRNALFDDMADITKSVANEGFEKMQKGYKADLLVRHALGELIDKIFNAKNLDDAGIKEELNKLANYWGQNITAIYDLRNVALAFTREFLVEQVQECMSNGNYLTWTHFKELQKVKEAKRISVLNKVRQHSWSAKELALELQGSGNNEHPRSGGRNPTIPKTPTGMLQKIFTTAQHTDNYLAAVLEPMENMKETLDDSSVDSKFVENLGETMICIQSTIENCKKAYDSLLSIQDKVSYLTTTSSLAAKSNKDEVEPVAQEKRRGRPPKIKVTEEQEF
jgi:hypothetical protein